MNKDKFELNEEEMMQEVFSSKENLDEYDERSDGNDELEGEDEELEDGDLDADDDLDEVEDLDEDGEDDLDEYEDLQEVEYEEELELLGPDPETGEPRVEILMDPMIAKASEASEFLRGILLRMGLSGRIAVTSRHGSIYLEINGAEPGLVIGHRGQNLDALQHLVNRMVNRYSEDMIPITVDSDDYRSRRLQQLEAMVKQLSRDALSSGDTITTEPLTPSERRLFHIAASQFKGIRTESIGEGFFQPIRIIPQNHGHRQFGYSSHRRYDNSAPPNLSNKRNGRPNRNHQIEQQPPDYV